MIGNFRIGSLVAVLTIFTPLSFAIAQSEGAPPKAVTVRTLQPQTVALTVTLPGRVRPSAQAEVRPQVNGIVTERLFDEGSQVSVGDVLYRVDPATYEAAVAQARANVSQAEAQLGAAKREADRISTLSERGISSTANEDEAVSARDAATAALELATSQLQSAELELDRTEIRARLSGQIGFSQTSAGALVTASQAEPMAVIRAIDPIYVDVTQSAAELLEWRRRRMGEAEMRPSEVKLVLADGSTFDQTGQLTAAEPHVDEVTGVVSLRVEFENPDKLLLPGMYVQVEMPTGNVDDVFLAPQEAVLRDRRGNPSALVVNADNVVEERALTIIRDRGSDWIVEDGLKPGDRIIVAGGQSVAAGATVTPEEESREKAEEAPEAKAEGKGEKSNDTEPAPAAGSEG
ncbi:efflux RND transporter periplasmic adaptor subunit [Notoacmeibacter ruber]|uniref:Efflux RND transporter periplasmic adaptor subunit n=1 Tax=Notoacmeibacter ruber TaxID=2670375 RepID=A0A3L7JKU7_9HYPH|nr:efflux RND transporter periplasmic adaptor subunit [Notoacmeibacter ruber]RLQ89142.1 efflux RND transporter periplasmic adaptor subunit [Notoacmeibacter ruber]